MTPVTVFGEALVDLVDQGARRYQAVAGGGPANVALGLARLGVPASLVTGLGDDAFGRLVRAHLTGSGVRLSEQRAPFTAMAIVTLDAGSPTYDFALSWRPATPDVPAGSPALVTGSLTAAFAAEQTEEAMRSARAAEVVVAYDPNLRPAFSGDREADRSRVSRQVALSDIVKVSEEDIAWLHPGADPLEIASAWLGQGPSLVVLTQGPKGSTALAPGVTAEAAAPTVTVVDTVGAGDAYLSGLLYGLLETGSLSRDGLTSLTRAALEPVIARATLAAAITCTRQGADPPTAAELLDVEGAAPAR